MIKVELLCQVCGDAMGTIEDVPRGMVNYFAVEPCRNCAAEQSKHRTNCWSCECGYSMPEPLQYCVKCDARRHVDRSSPIHKDWDTPEEDEAWKDL